MILSGDGDGGDGGTDNDDVMCVMEVEMAAAATQHAGDEVGGSIGIGSLAKIRSGTCDGVK